MDTRAAQADKNRESLLMIPLYLPTLVLCVNLSIRCILQLNLNIHFSDSTAADDPGGNLRL